VIAQPQASPVAFVSFSAEIVPKTTESLLALCANLANQGTQTVHLLLSTLGGNVMHGMNIYNVLRALPFKLITHNVGSVNSIGNVIFLAGEERYACANSTFMFHGVGFDVNQAVRFEEKLLKERLDAIQADQKRIAAIISERTKIGLQEIEGLFLQASTKDTDYAKTNGIIDDIREAKVPPGTPVFQLVFDR
jgi:ATP-dependent protease ClpP protease subunit